MKPSDSDGAIPIGDEQDPRGQRPVRKAEKSGWRRVGQIGVDAGLCWIGDPCYCVTPDADEHPAPTWDAFCAELENSDDDVVKQWYCKLGQPGLGVSVSTGGDGVFPVYVRFGSDGRALEAKVVFDEEE